MRAVRLWDQNYSLLIFSWGAPLTSAPTLMEGRCKPKLIEINDLLIWRLWAQNTNYIRLQKSEVYCSVEFWVCGCTCPMSANQTSPALSSTMILLPNDSFFLSNTESLQLEATTKGNFHFYIFGGFFLYVTIPQVSEGATSVFHHPALMLDYFAVSPLCFAENPEPPGKPRWKGHWWNTDVAPSETEERSYRGRSPQRAPMGKNLPTMQETQFQEDPLEKRMDIHSSILVWRIPWTKETGGLQSMGAHRVRHDWETNTHKHIIGETD